MPIPLINITALLLFTLAATMACTGATPAPDQTETTAPASMAAATPLPANPPTLEARSTPVPTPEPTPTEGPTAGPNSTLSQEPTASPTPDWRLAPLPHQDSQALEAALSDAELSCISDDPEELARALAGYGTTSPELDFTHFKRHKRGNLQYDGTEWRGVSVHRSWRSIVKNPPTPTTSGYAQR